MVEFYCFSLIWSKQFVRGKHLRPKACFVFSKLFWPDDEWLLKCHWKQFYLFRPAGPNLALSRGGPELTIQGGGQNACATYFGHISSMEARIFMKFETYVHKIILDHQLNFHKDPCKDARARGVNARTREEMCASKLTIWWLKYCIFNLIFNKYELNFKWAWHNFSHSVFLIVINLIQCVL